MTKRKSCQPFIESLIAIWIFLSSDLLSANLCGQECWNIGSCRLGMAELRSADTERFECWRVMSYPKLNDLVNSPDVIGTRAIHIRALGLENYQSSIWSDSMNALYGSKEMELGLRLFTSQVYWNRVNSPILKTGGAHRWSIKRQAYLPSARCNGPRNLLNLFGGRSGKLAEKALIEDWPVSETCQISTL
ncbi:hypothetical protein HNY73_001284 [Argiope bruennichi]|uniref:Uncharacterized protein n=1 Tax=Argiope bruennichi TaxID=94029 RepID=A0A8T0G4H3_ARGBR|nr:hypothetical protein HNY73_001284 [Argiope bruennichi]